MIHRAFAAMFVTAVAAWPLRAQTPELRFDVASIRQNLAPVEDSPLRGGFCSGSNSDVVVTAPLSGPSAPRQGLISPGSCRFGATTLKEIIAAAYAMPRRDFERLIVGGPKWIGTDRFDIDARADRVRPQGELEQMLQALLADRFGLRLHRETREVDGYSLERGNAEVKMTPADAFIPTRINTVGLGSLTARGTSMQRLALLLTTLFDKPVVDNTGLTGNYDFTLKWTASSAESTPFGPMPPDLRQRLEATADPLGPSIFTAVEEQLGLRLQPQKVPASLLVIDAANHPSPN